MFNARLKEIRKERGYTMKSASEKMEMSFSTYSKYESGERSPDLATLVRLAKFFECSTDYLLGLTNFPRGYIQKAPPELEDAGLESVTKTKDEPLTAQEIEAIRNFLQQRKG